MISSEEFLRWFDINISDLNSSFHKEANTRGYLVYFLKYPEYCKLDFTPRVKNSNMVNYSFNLEFFNPFGDICVCTRESDTSFFVKITLYRDGLLPIILEGDEAYFFNDLNIIIFNLLDLFIGDSVNNCYISEELF